MLTKLPVILDTDIGTDIDDAFALALVLASPELDLGGVTTVSDDAFGRALIACRFLEAAGRGDVPVSAGRPRRETPAATGQYAYGLNAGRKHPEPDLAVEFLYRQLKARPGEITIITVGDLTNLGELITRHPEAKPWIRGVVMMGGSVRVGYAGQPPPEREWNLRSDVRAAQVLFRSGIPLTVAPLDATLVRFPEPLRRRVFETPNPVCQELWSLYKLWARQTPTLFDPVAVTLAFNESFVTMESLRIEVDELGFTREVPGEPNCRQRGQTRVMPHSHVRSSRPPSVSGWMAEHSRCAARFSSGDGRFWRCRAAGAGQSKSSAELSGSANGSPSPAWLDRLCAAGPGRTRSSPSAAVLPQ
jgi:inosine-uridine nucleoside N-ribohydrolase